jgi:DNA-binding NarL/FixJ family response regulator
MTLELVGDRPYHTAEWADGKKLAEWLYENKILGNERDPEWKNIHRRVRIYASGSEDASLDVVDRIMVKARSHISEIPDEVWLTQRRSRPRETKATPEMREEAVRRVKEGETMVAVAKSMGVKAKTVQTWVFRAGVSVRSLREEERQRRMREVFRLLDEGLTPTEIHRETGIARHSIYDWMEGRKGSSVKWKAAA